MIVIPIVEHERAAVVVIMTMYSSADVSGPPGKSESAYQQATKFGSPKNTSGSNAQDEKDTRHHVL